MTDASSTMPFVIITGENAASKHLLELVRIKASPPLLETHHGETRYALPVPTWSLNEGGKITKWLIGAGSSSTAETGASPVEPDILLCPPGPSPSASCARDSVRALQAVLYFHPRSGALMLENRSGTPIDYKFGNGDGQHLSFSKHVHLRTVLWKQKNYISLGEYLFAISFVTEGRDQAYMAYVDEQFNRNIGRLYNDLPPSGLLNFVPGPFASLCGNMAAHKDFPNNHMVAGVDILTGEPVVLKYLYRDSVTLDDSLTRFEMITDKGRCSEGVMKALEFWCKCGPVYHRQGYAQECACERIDYCVPLAEHSFLSMPWAGVKMDDRIRYFKQTLSGLAYVHDNGIAHGHISPTSLLILTGEGRESSDSGGYLLKDLKAVLSLCMRPTKVRTQSLCIAPELLDALPPGELHEIAVESGAQGTGEDQPVDVLPGYESNASVDEYLDFGSIEEIDRFFDNNTAEAVDQLFDSNAYDTDQIFGITDGALDTTEDRESLQVDERGMAADVWALAMSWLSALVDLPQEQRITRELHRQLLDDLEEKTIKGSINEQLMALIIRRMLQWEPQKRLSADDALGHPAWDLMVVKGDHKRKREERTRRGSHSPAPGEKRCRPILLD